MVPAWDPPQSRLSRGRGEGGSDWITLVGSSSRARSAGSLLPAGLLLNAPGEFSLHLTLGGDPSPSATSMRDEISSRLSSQGLARTSAARLDSQTQSPICSSFLEREFAEEISRGRRRATAQPDVTERRSRRWKHRESLPTVGRRAIPEDLLQVRPPFVFSRRKVAGSDAARLGGQFDPFVIHRTYLG